MSSASTAPVKNLTQAHVAVKPYVRPVLARLGSVREITLGATTGSNEFGMRGG
jgi:hypothetical protein